MTEFAYLDVKDACRRGTLLVRGPLNDAYRVELGGESLFVRRRTMRDPEYGQTFAAERFVPAPVLAALNTPALLQLLTDEDGREEFALFEFIETASRQLPPDPEELVGVLMTIHNHAAKGLGDIRSEHIGSDAASFIRSLVDAEVSRLPERWGDYKRSYIEQRVSFDSFAGEAPCLVHGDVHSGNFLRRADGAVAVVDWEAVRFRVAAADFNQMCWRWMTEHQAAQVARLYASARGIDLERFVCQIDTLRYLWHLRTFNFFCLVRNESADRHIAHLSRASNLLLRL